MGRTAGHSEEDEALKVDKRLVDVATGEDGREGEWGEEIC